MDPLLFFVLNVVGLMIPIPGPSGFLAVTAGSFGIVEGTVMYICSALVAAMLSFGLGRNILRSTCDRLFAMTGYNRMLEAFEDVLNHSEPFWLVWLLRINPVFPYQIVSLMSSQLPINILQYAAGTATSLFPSSFMYILAGNVAAKWYDGVLSGGEKWMNVCFLVFVVACTYKVVFDANKQLKSRIKLNFIEARKMLSMLEIKDFGFKWKLHGGKLHVEARKQKHEV